LRAQESVVIPLYYQNVSPEPKVEDTSLEVHWVPIAFNKSAEVFLDVKGALIAQQTGTPVSVSPLNIDGRCTLGVDVSGERGKIRFFYRYDRTSDPEVNNNPV